MAVLSGLVDDQDILQNERVIDMDDEITMLDPDTTQFTTLLSQVAKKGADSTKVEWLEDQLFPRLSAVSGSQTDSDADIEVTTGEGVYFRAGDVVRNQRTGEAFKVVSVSTDTLTCTGNRGIGRVAAAAMNNGDQLLIVANAAAQGATLGTRKVNKRVAQYNYTQIVRNPYGFTRSLMASRLYGGAEPGKERAKKAIEHKRSIEYLLFWGTRALNTSGNEPVGFAGGLYEFVTTNVKNAAGSLTKALLDTYFRDFLQHAHSRSVVFFVSPVIAQAISGFLRDAWQPASVDAKLWGAKVDGFISGAYGYRVPVIVKKDWNDFSTSNTQFGGWGFSVDMENVALRTLRNTALLRDRQANDADSYDEEYLTELSVQISQEKHHGVVTGVTG